MNEKKTRILQEAIKNKNWFGKINSLFRMLVADITGKFKMKKRYFILFILALVYIISPIDFIPGWFFPIIGLTDDLSVLVLSVSLLMTEVNRFIQWELDQKLGVKTIDIESN